MPYNSLGQETRDMTIQEIAAQFRKSMQDAVETAILKMAYDIINKRTLDEKYKLLVDYKHRVLHAKLKSYKKMPKSKRRF